MWSPQDSRAQGFSCLSLLGYGRAAVQAGKDGRHASESALGLNRIVSPLSWRPPSRERLQASRALQDKISSLPESCLAGASRRCHYAQHCETYPRSCAPRRWKRTLRALPLLQGVDGDAFSSAVRAPAGHAPLPKQMGGFGGVGSARQAARTPGSLAAITAHIWHRPEDMERIIVGATISDCDRAGRLVAPCSCPGFGPWPFPIAYFCQPAATAVSMAPLSEETTYYRALYSCCPGATSSELLPVMGRQPKGHHPSPVTRHPSPVTRQLVVHAAARVLNR